MIGCTRSEILKFWSLPSETLEYHKLEFLAHHFGTSVTSIIDGTYNKSEVRLCLFGAGHSLPEKYMRDAFSRVRSSAHIIEYLVCRYGRAYADGILRSLRVNPCYFENLNNEISLTFSTDLLATLKERGMGDAELQRLPIFLPLTIGETSIGYAFAQAKTFEHSFEVMCQNTFRFDMNFDYHYTFGNTGMEISTEPKDHVYELMEKDGFLKDTSVSGWLELFKYRQTLFGCIPILSELQPLQVREKMQLKTKNSRCWKYTIDYPSVIKPLLKSTIQNARLQIAGNGCQYQWLKTESGEKT